MLHRATLRRYREYLVTQGFTVEYLETAALEKSADIYEKLAGYGVSEVHMCDPLENGLIEEIEQACSVHGIRLVTYESPLFLCSREYLKDFTRKAEVLPHRILYRTAKTPQDPFGRRWKTGRKRWTFDTLNREPLPKDFPIPPVWHPPQNEYVTEAMSYVQEHFPGAYGDVNAFFWPVTYEDANRWFDDFLMNRLVLFGQFEDAIHRDETVLFHSALSPLLNIGLLTPGNVVDAALRHARDHEIPITSLEGFIRQMIGWREFIRAVYLIAEKKNRPQTYWAWFIRSPLFLDGFNGYRTR